MIENQLINHIFFVIDKSMSMHDKARDVVAVFDGQIQHLAQRSQELDQETRVSVFFFSNDVECIVYDKDVLRLPSLQGLYRVGGGTALIDATVSAINDLKKTPELYCNHAFLGYVLTDGEENLSRKNRATDLARIINALPDNWTIATLVPNILSVSEAKRFGFPKQNIQVWSTENSKGMVEVGETIRRATDNFMTARSTGTRGTKNLFSMDVSNLTKTAVKNILSEVKAKDYLLLPVRREEVIKDFVESWTQTNYRPGSAYYQLTKKETVQASKQLCVQEKVTGKVYGGTNARQLLGLPNHEVKVAPDQHDKFNIFVQSTSVNRKLVGGTNLIVLL
jgi:hypothetical protein